MSEENTTTTTTEASPIAEGTRSPVEKPVSTEVATDSQEKDIDLPDYGALVEESKKYRKRAQANMREEILADFSQDDRETFGDLPIAKLRALHGKIIKNPKVAVANNPAVAGSDTPQDWTKMNRNERTKHWDKIVASYIK